MVADYNCACCSNVFAISKPLWFTSQSLNTDTFKFSLGTVASMVQYAISQLGVVIQLSNRPENLPIQT